jgi:hypothetical protein
LTGTIAQDNDKVLLPFFKRIVFDRIVPPFHFINFSAFFHFFIRFHLVQCLYARSRKSRHVQDLLVEDLLQPCQEMEAQQARSRDLIEVVINVTASRKKIKKRPSQYALRAGSARQLLQCVLIWAT